MRLTHSRPVILLIFWILLSLTSKEQTGSPSYSVINYNSDNALPQNSINDMAFDGNGFLWLATEMGMIRFDGQHFREYTMNNTPALYTNRCYMVSSVKGNVLINPGFSSHRILTVTNDYQLKPDSALSANPYQCSRWNNCTFYYDHIFKKWHGDSTVFNGLLNRLEFNGNLVTVNERQAYVRKNSNCYYLDDNTASIQLLRETEGHAFKMLFIVDDICFYIDRQNHIYPYRKGLLQKNIICSKALIKILNQAESGEYPSQYTINAIRDPYHTFLVYRSNILLLKIRNGVLDYEVLAANTAIRSINCLIYDERAQTLFIGTATNGLYILKKHTFRRLFFASDHYAINSLYAQAEVSTGKILTSSGVLSANSAVNAATPGLYDRPALLRSSDGYIWYSNFDVLKKTDTTLHNAVSVQYLGSWLMSIIEAGNKDLYYCTLHKLFRRRGNDTVTILHMAEDMQVISEVFPDDLWIGTSAGLFSYNQINGALRRLALPNVSVRAIYRAANRTVWIGTYGQGFYKYENSRFIKMPMDAGNNLATVHCFMEDKQGYFWLSTNKGLYRVARKELEGYAAGNREKVFYYYFDKSTGYSTNEFNGGCTPCGIVMRDGHFSLPSLDGLIQFIPDSIPIELPASPVFIDRVITEENKILPGDHFKHRQDSGPLIFMIASPYYGNPANLHLEYSIKQLDNKWRPVNSDGRLVLTGLRNGSYTLMVRKQEGYGRYAYKQISWTILPYWYETFWFWLLIALVSISSLFLIFFFLYTREVKRAAELEQKVAERTEALKASNRVKEKMIDVILHDLRSPLRFLHLLADHIYNNYQKTPRQKMYEMLLKFRNATHDLNDFTQDFVTWTNAQKDGFVIRREKIPLREIVTGIVSMYEPAAAVNNNRLLNLVPAGIIVISDANILKLIIRNLADNANKYTENGEISIEAKQGDNTISIIITDTGRSMDKQLATDIMNNTYQAENDRQGFGYQIILQLLARIEGKLSIDIPEETGNRIAVILRSDN